MPRACVTADPADPAFPHGTPAGYRRGCKCDTCSPAFGRQMKIGRVNRARAGGHIRWATPEEAARTRTHIKALLEAPRSSYRAIAAAAGISSSTVSDVLAGRRRPSSRTTTVLLAVRPEQVKENRGWLTAEEKDQTLRLVGSLQAQGYPVTWIEQQTGHNIRHHTRHAKHSPRTARAVRDLAARIGSTQATTEATGVPRRGITLARAIARKHGYHPLDCYGDDGNYSPRLDPEHPWAVADSRCSEILTIAARLVRHGRDLEAEPYRVIAERCGTYVEEVERIAKKLGVGPKTAAREKNAARAREALNEWDTGARDVVRVAVDLGLGEWDNNAGLVPRDHPAIADLVAKSDAAKRQRQEEAKARKQAAKRDWNRRHRAEARQRKTGVAA